VARSRQKLGRCGAPGARTPGQLGRTPLKGAKLPTLAEIAKAAVFQAVTVTSPDGRSRTAHIHQFVCLWYKPFHTRPVKLILTRNLTPPTASTSRSRQPTSRSPRPS
jgi:hypothetical protein